MDGAVPQRTPRAGLTVSGDRHGPRREPGFAELVGDVRRLEHDTVEPARPQRRPRRAQPAPTAEAAADTWSDAAAAADDGDDFHRPGVQRGILRRLRRGHYAIEDEVDLHGLTLAEARAHLAGFLAHARRERVRCVRVIHGKGLSSPGMNAVLKPRVRHWLRQDERVLAFTAAAPRDGGAGALYVLLRSTGRAER